MKYITVSIVLYKHTYSQIEPLLTELLSCKNIKRIFLIDNFGSQWTQTIYLPEVTYVGGHGNVGYGAGHNLAIFHELNKSDFHLVCNPDIRIPNGTLEQLINFAEHSSAALFMPCVLYPSGKPQELCKLLPTPLDLFARRFLRRVAQKREYHYLLRMADFTKPFWVPYLSGCFMFMRTSALQKIGGFDERFFMYLEDTDLSRRMAKSYGAYYYPDCYVYHEFQKGSYKSINLLKCHIVSAIQYFNKWGWFVDNERNKLNSCCLSQFKKHER